MSKVPALPIGRRWGGAPDLHGGRTDEAITAPRDLVVACGAQGVALVEGWVQRNLAIYAQQAGAPREARRAAVASLDLGRRVGLPMVELSALVTLGSGTWPSPRGGPATGSSRSGRRAGSR